MCNGHGFREQLAGEWAPPSGAYLEAAAAAAAATRTASSPSSRRRVVAYVRVSSKGQNDAMQRDAITRRGLHVDRWYAEKASAGTLGRPVLQELLVDVRAGLVDELVVFKLDRLTRSGVADTFAVVTELRKAGVQLHCVADHLVVKPGEDLASDVFLFALALAGMLVRVAINDRIAAARTNMKRQGRKWGRPSRVSPATLLRAKELRAKGRTLRQVAAALGIPRSTLARAVS